MQEITVRPLSSGRFRTPVAPSKPEENAANTAGFFDWSSDVNQCIAVSKYSTSGSVFPSRIEGNAKKKKLKQWYSTNGAKLANITAHSGRMFHREKTSMTKGERQIVQGICHNRGMKDVKRNETKCDLEVEASQLLSHKDAWLIGKQVPRAQPFIKVKPRENSLCFCDETFSTRYSDRILEKETLRHDGETTLCEKCGGCILVFNDTDSEFQNTILSPKGSESSKESLCSILTEKVTSPHKKIPPINSGRGAAFVKEIFCRSTRDPRAVEKKTMVDVYLPRMAHCRDMSRTPTECSSSASSRSDCDTFEPACDSD